MTKKFQCVAATHPALNNVSRSGYYGFCKRIGDPEPDAELAELLQSQQERCRQTYGYRRMWLWLEKQGITRSPKTVLRVMKKYSILADCHESGEKEGRCGVAAPQRPGVPVHFTGGLQPNTRMERRRLHNVSPHNSIYFLPGAFLCCPHKLGRFTFPGGFFASSGPGAVRKCFLGVHASRKSNGALFTPSA